MLPRTGPPSNTRTAIFSRAPEFSWWARSGQRGFCPRHSPRERGRRARSILPDAPRERGGGRVGHQTVLEADGP